MARTTRYTVRLEDVNGSFARFIKQAPKTARKYLSTAVFLTTSKVHDRMETGVPVDQGELKSELSFEHRGLRGRAGILQSEGEDGPAHIALYNEYMPNKQPFMRPAAQAEKDPFLERAKRALEQCERDLSL